MTRLLNDHQEKERALNSAHKYVCASRASRQMPCVRGDRRVISDAEDVSKDVEKTVSFPRPFSPRLVFQMLCRADKCIVNARPMDRSTVLFQ